MEELVYGVIFKGNDKVYSFKSKENYEVGTYVIVDTERGLQYGKVTSVIKNNLKEEYKSVVRKATKEDQTQFELCLKDADKALKKCKQIVEELNLDMYVLNATFNFDKTQLLINFTADERIDFRELAKKMASIYHTRIELRQIGARDKAKLVGGLGVCGQQLCCQRFLNQIDSISMNRAKNQNLALNPSKINGSCGRLLCCLCYEDDLYTENRVGLLNVGAFITINGKKGKIVSVDILSRKYKVEFEDGIEVVEVDTLNDLQK